MTHLHSRPVRSLGLATAMAIALTACGSIVPSPTVRPSPSLAGSPGVSVQPSTAPVTGQTLTAWGPIWDSLPPGFPVIPGATPAEEAGGGPASATLAIDGGDAQTIATTLRSQLEAAGFAIEALNGPAEDGGYVLDAAGSADDCRVRATVAPLGGLTIVSILYGTACPNI